MAVSILMLFLTGCTQVTQYGDARYIKRMHPLFVTLDTLRLPDFELRQQTVRWTVRGMPYPVHPDSLVIEARPEDIQSHTGPWTEGILELQIIPLDGRESIRRTLQLREWKGGANYVDGKWQVVYHLWEDRSTGWPPLIDTVDYDIMMEVLQPSLRPGDTAFLQGHVISGGPTGVTPLVR